jgi:hypothetical protein
MKTVTVKIAIVAKGTFQYNLHRARFQNTLTNMKLFHFVQILSAYAYFFFPRVYIRQ